jgi:hypothetical protein
MRNVIGFTGAALVVAVALACLGISLSGLMAVEPAGGLLRTLGGLVAFLIVVMLTLVAAARS